MNKTKENIIRHMKESEYFTEYEIDFMLKNKEGYDPESLFYATEDYNLLQIAEEELEKRLMKNVKI